MNGKWFLAALPVVVALAAFGLFATLQHAPNAPALFLLQGVVAAALASAGGIVGALAFDRGDYMFRAWGLLGLGYALLVVNAVFFGVWSAGAEAEVTTAGAVASGVLVVAGNGSLVAGLVLVTRAWRVAGLDLGVSRAARVGAVLASLALALAIVGATLWSDLQSLLGGDVQSLVYLASDVGDVTMLALVAPILLSAFALRGGALTWPWTLLAVSIFGWLVFDAIALLGPKLLADASALRPAEQAVRVFACTSMLAAGLLQRAALRTPARAPSHAG
jgi:uncharacterized protein (DUF983 family)